jgi:hypothetical protein
MEQTCCTLYVVPLASSRPALILEHEEYTPAGPDTETDVYVPVLVASGLCHRERVRSMYSRT